MMKRRTDNREGGAGGFTIIELLISLVVFAVVMTMAFSFLQTQNQGFKKGLDYMSTTQTLRYAVGVLEQDIQTAATNLVPGQPEIVFAGPTSVAFNADYATRTRDDPWSVFYDPDLEDRAVRVWNPGSKGTIPGGDFVYPDSLYKDKAGLPGSAETVIFFVVSDDDTSRDDDYALYRQVNAGEPQLVATNLLKVEGEPFFRYLTETETGLDSIPDGVLPIAHEVAVHESPADTGQVALVDSIRAVRLTFAATNGKEGDLERTSEVTRIVRMPNMGFELLEICGSTPILGTTLNANLVTPVDAEGVPGPPYVTLTWNRSVDEGGGEDDVVRYVIWRREVGEDWEEPYLSIPAGEESYSYQDAALEAGHTYQYALAAQDCTPTLSPLGASSTVTVPAS